MQLPVLIFQASFKTISCRFRFRCISERHATPSNETKYCAEADLFGNGSCSDSVNRKHQNLSIFIPILRHWISEIHDNDDWHRVCYTTVIE